MRLAMFAAMAAFLVAALCVPGAFGSEALLFACAYATVRAAHIVLFMLASSEDGRCATRSSGSPRAPRSAPVCCSRRRSRPAACNLGCGAWRWCSTWAGRTCSEPRAGSSCPVTSPSATGLIVIIALGESIVAIGVGAKATIDAGVVRAAVLGLVVAAALWWAYFDVVAIVAARRLAKAR